MAWVQRARPCWVAAVAVARWPSAFPGCWRGESFYSKASEPQINDGNQLRTRCKQPGREFILVETTRYKGLESSLGPEFKGKVNIVDRSNAKWYLVAVDD